MMHLLVAMGLVNNIILSRLLAGHSHCDPDGLFGVIWQVFILDSFDFSLSISSYHPVYILGFKNIDNSDPTVLQICTRIAAERPGYYC